MLLPDEQAGSGSSGEAPISADEFQLRFDVVNQKCHVPVQIKLGHFKNQGIAQHCLSTNSVNLMTG
jgi:hypothetical protein